MDADDVTYERWQVPPPPEMPPETYDPDDELFRLLPESLGIGGLRDWLPTQEALGRGVHASVSRVPIAPEVSCPYRTVAGVRRRCSDVKGHLGRCWSAGWLEEDGPFVRTDRWCPEGRGFYSKSERTLWVHHRDDVIFVVEVIP